MHGGDRSHAINDETKKKACMVGVDPGLGGAPKPLEDVNGPAQPMTTIMDSGDAERNVMRAHREVEQAHRSYRSFHARGLTGKTK